MKYSRIAYVFPSWIKRSQLGVRYHLDFENTPPSRLLASQLKEYFHIENSDFFFLSSGRSCIEFALRVLQQRSPEKTDVVIPTYACKAIIDAIIKCGLNPILIDVDTSLLPDHKNTIKLLNNHTLACLVHNLSGRDNSSEDLLKICENKNIIIIDDQCQSFFLPKKQNENIITILSFAASKTLSATAGGALITFNQGSDFEKEYRKLETEEELTVTRRKNAYIKKYTSLLGKLKFRLFGDCPLDFNNSSSYEMKKMSTLDFYLCLNQMRSIKKLKEDLNSNFLTFKALIEEKFGTLLYACHNLESCEYLLLHFKTNQAKLNFQHFLNSQNIELQELYIPLHLSMNLTPFRLPKSEEYYKNVLNFPIRSNLRKHEQKRIIKALKSLSINEEA